MSLKAPMATTTTTVAKLNGKIATPIPGVATVTIENSTLPDNFTAKVNGFNATAETREGTTIISVEVGNTGEIAADSEVVADTAIFTEEKERISISGNTITVDLDATDDLAALAPLAKGTLTESATAVIKTTNGEVKVELTPENAISKILETLTSRGITAAELITLGNVSVTLIDKDDSTKTTAYTLSFK